MSTFLSLIIGLYSIYGVPETCLIQVNVNDHSYEVGFNRVETENDNPYTEDEKAKARVKANLPPIL
jgi:hypothetical protein